MACLLSVLEAQHYQTELAYTITVKLLNSQLCSAKVASVQIRESVSSAAAGDAGSEEGLREELRANYQAK